jgi:hypothetical protein
MEKSSGRKRDTHKAAGETRVWFVMSAIGIGIACALIFLIGFTTVFASLGAQPISYVRGSTGTSTPSTAAKPTTTLDVAAYNKKLLQLANYPKPLATSTASSTVSTASSTSGQASSPQAAAHRLWPVTTAPLPLAGALLPFNRIVAYYGNFYSTGMGVLGEYPEPQVITMLQGVVAQWQAADPSTPVIPAIDYIAVTAQGSPGSDGKYRLRMPDSQIQKAIDMATQVHGIVILEVQAGLSNIQTEVPLLEQYLKMPQVELALDPEFAMQTSGLRPEAVIGTLDATDINFAANYLANLVTQNNLPPKILIVHRFTEDMVTHYRKITPLPQVQIVMDMDGWGSQAKKIGTYTNAMTDEPVQFTGFKLFYKNDLKAPSSGMLTPAQILKLIPQPSFIQYQ